MPPRSGLDAYREVWLVDFEFSAPPGERPDPVCLVAREFRSGRTLRLWQDDLRGRRVPPYPIGPDVLVRGLLRVGRAGLSSRPGLADCRSGSWISTSSSGALPTGSIPYCGNGLLGALAWHGLDAMDAAEKDSMRKLAMRGGPWSE